MVDVGPEFAFGGLPLHGSDHLAIDHEAADVLAIGLLDELLHKDVRLHRLERVDHTLCGLVGLGEDDAASLGGLEQLDDERCPVDHPDEVLGVHRRLRKARDGDVDVVLGEEVGGVELVPRVGDGVGGILAVDAEVLELAEQGAAVEGHGRLDARNDGVELVEDVAAPVPDLGRMHVELHVRMLDVEEHHLVAPGGAGFHDALVAVQLGVGGEDANAQACFLLVVGLVQRFDFGVGDVALHKFLGHVHEKAVHEGVAAEEHAELHGVAVGEGQVHFECVLAKGHVGLDDEALLGDARGVLHRFAASHAGLTRNGDASVVLDGVDLKLDPLLAVLGEQLDAVGLERGGLRTGVDPGFHGRHPQLGKSAPLDTSNHVHGSGFFEKERKDTSHQIRFGPAFRITVS